MKRICLFGDSISKGVVIDGEHDRYMMTEKSFANILSSDVSWLDIVNHSMLGCTISKGLSLFRRYIKDVESCDIAVIEYGGNDSDHNWAEIAANPDGAHLPKTTLEDFRKNYLEIVSSLQGMEKKIVLINLPPIDEKKYFSWFTRGLSSDGILKWLGGNIRYIYDFHESYNSVVCDIAKEHDLPLIDVRSVFLETPDFSSFLCDDGIHPNEKGHNLMAQIIGSKLPELSLLLGGKPISAFA